MPQSTVLEKHDEDSLEILGRKEKPNYRSQDDDEENTPCSELAKHLNSEISMGSIFNKNQLQHVSTKVVDTGSQFKTHSP